MSKKVLIAIIAVLVLAFIGYKFLYQNHRNIAEEKPKYQVDAGFIAAEFAKGDKAVQDKYLNQTLLVKGIISEIHADYIIIEDKAYTAINTKDLGLQKNKKIAVKGRCIGYDDLLEQVKFDQCTLINK